MPITLEANGKDIRVTGGTSGAPVTWDAIVAANDSGGWGRITTVNAGQHVVATDTRIFIGDNGVTSTYVAVERCQIVFSNGYFQILSGADVTKATLRLGRPGEPWYGAQVTLRGLTTDALVRLAGSGTLLMYWSVLWIANHLVGGGITANINDSAINGANWWGGGNVTMTNTVLATFVVFGSPVNPTPAFLFNRCIISSYDAYGRSVSLRDATIARFLSRNDAVLPEARLYDTPAPAVFNATTAATYFPVLYEYATLAVSVVTGAGTAVAGASVVVRNAGGATVYSGITDAAGRIPNQDILFRTRTLIGGTSVTEIVATPHTVTITKSGFLERVLTLDMSAKHVEVEVLEPLPDFPAVGDVRAGVDYDDGALVGTLALPAVGDVRDGVGYGAWGAELVGAFSPTVVVGEGVVAAISEDALSCAVVEDALVVTVED